MHEHAKEIRIPGSRTCQLMLTDNCRNILSYTVTVADAETEFFISLIKKRQKWEVIRNVSPSKSNAKGDEEDKDQFSRDLVHNVCSLRNVLENILKYVRYTQTI